MPDICAFPHCHVSRTPKYAGISLFQFPTRKDEFYTSWRQNLLGVLLKYRVLDSETIKKVMDGKTKMYFCERHFQEDDIELSFIRGDGKKRQLKLQVLPSREFPKKSIETSTAIERRPLIRKVVEEAPQKVHVYRDFSELCKRVQTLRFSWKLEIGTEVELKKITRPYIVPEFEIIISDSLQFTVAVYGWLLPSDHPLYDANSRSMHGISVSALK